MTSTAIPTMVVDDVDQRARLSILALHADPINCDHAWEPHLWETGRAHCPRCGSFARWVNDLRATEESSS